MFNFFKKKPLSIIEPNRSLITTKSTWLINLKNILLKTSNNFTKLFTNVNINSNIYEELESALLISDAGIEATQFLLQSLKKAIKEENLIELHQIHSKLHDLLIDLLQPLEKSLILGKYKPLVILVVGVNGVGKTTTIGKLAQYLQIHKQSVVLAAADTFRAAAYEQLAVWGERNNISVISQKFGDPAAIAFDTIHSAQAQNTDIVIIDTAGRLPTQLHLMNELKKIKRVINKSIKYASHETLLILDGNTGQNGLAQVKAFNNALGLTGLIITKLDGTTKGGILAAIAQNIPIPLYFIGVGEQINDLQTFNTKEFVDALLN